MKETGMLEDLGAEAPVRLGVFGDPVAHSLSPPMQNAALAACGLKLRYGRFRILPHQLLKALRRCAEADFVGVNLTVPHKLAGFALVQETDSFAQAAGAINTIRFAGNKWLGANTDGPGFERAVRESLAVELRALRVLVLGAGGGAGRAVAAQCALSGCPAVTLVNRDFAKAEALARRWDREQISAVPWSDNSLGEAVAASDLIVQATPLGLRAGDPSPLASVRQRLAARHLVYDLNFRTTALLDDAREAGARGANGLTMLLHQGALAFEFWFGRAAPLAAMREGLGLEPAHSGGPA